MRIYSVNGNCTESGEVWNIWLCKDRKFADYLRDWEDACLMDNAFNIHKLCGYVLKDTVEYTVSEELLLD